MSNQTTNSSRFFRSHLLSSSLAQFQPLVNAELKKIIEEKHIIKLNTRSVEIILYLQSP